MGFIANFKAKRAAKRAQSVYQSELFEWERENQVLAQALDIFTAASSGSEPDDHSLAQKKASWFYGLAMLFTAWQVEHPPHLAAAPKAFLFH